MARLLSVGVCVVEIEKLAVSCGDLDVYDLQGARRETRERARDRV